MPLDTIHDVVKKNETVCGEPFPVRLPGTPEAIAAGCTCTVDVLAKDCPLHADPLSWEARQAAKHFERLAISKAIENDDQGWLAAHRARQPFAGLKPEQITIRHNLTKRLY